MAESTQIETSSLRVLVVEDSDAKYADVAKALEATFGGAIEVTRVQTVVEAEDLLRSGWGLLVLDVSMDISPGAAGPMLGGHANLGGLDLVETMYLSEIEIRTVLLTGFDYFQSAGSHSDDSEMLALRDIESKARGFLSENLLGCVRYGADGWEERLTNCLRGGGNCHEGIARSR